MKHCSSWTASVARLPRPLRRLQALFLLAFLLVGIAPLTVVGLGVAALDRQVLIEQAEQLLAARARVLADQLHGYLMERLGDARAMADVRDVTSMDPGRQQARLDELAARHPEFVRLATYELSGHRLAASAPGTELSIGERPAFRAVLERSEQTWELVEPGVADAPELVLLTPIRGTDRGVVGVLATTVDMERFAAAAAWVARAGGRGFVFDPRGRVVTRSPWAMPGTPASLPAPSAVLGEAPRVVRYGSNSGEGLIAGVAPVRTFGWTVVAERAETAVTGPADRLWRVALGVVAATALLAMVCAVLLARAVTRPLHQLVAAARAFGTGDATAPLPAFAYDDGEIGALTDAFGGMRAAITRLHDVSVILYHTADLDASLEAAVGHTVALTGATCGGLALAETGRLEVRHTVGLAPERIADGRAALDGSAIGEVDRGGSAVLVDRATASSRDRPLAAAWGIRSLAAAPLLGARGGRGVLWVADQRSDAFRQSHLHLLETLAHQVATVLENAELTRLAAEADAVRELNRQKSLLIAALSHELRTPLAVIVGWSEIAAQGDLDLAATREMCRSINAGAVRLARVVENVIEFSELDAGRVELGRAVVDLARVVADAAARLPPRTERVRVELPADLPSVVADPARLERIISLLIDNALKFSPADVPVVIGGRAEGDRVLVEVRDRGPGVPMHDRARVFEPLYRSDASHQQAVPGSGLGLAIARELVRLHGGELTVSDQPGGGSLFGFSIPTDAETLHDRPLE